MNSTARKQLARRVLAMMRERTQRPVTAIPQCSDGKCGQRQTALAQTDKGK